MRAITFQESTASLTGVQAPLAARRPGQWSPPAARHLVHYLVTLQMRLFVFCQGEHVLP